MSSVETLTKRRRKAAPTDPKRAVAYVRMLADSEEGATVARARALRAEGKSLRAVAAGLVAQGRRPRSGGEWAVQTIRRLVAVAG